MGYWKALCHSNCRPPSDGVRERWGGLPGYDNIWIDANGQAHNVADLETVAVEDLVSLPEDPAPTTKGTHSPTTVVREMIEVDDLLSESS
ncbi:hypothetical protein Dimus_030669, partial [Dionaea muscipula]